MSTYWGLVKARGLEGTRRRVLSVGPYALSVRGSALVGVMAIITAVMLVGIAIFILGHAEGDVVEYAVDDSRAFYIAEGGLERARGYLAALKLDDPNEDPVGTSLSGQVPGGGSYYVEVVADASGGSWLDAYEVISTGDKDGVLRQVKATVIAETFSMYSWFIESSGGGYSWFRSGERFEGPIHVNGDIRIDGDPWFGGYVRAAGGLTLKEGSNPTFVRGYELNVDPISLPSRAHVFATVKAAAQSTGGLVLPALGNQTYYDITLGDPYVGAFSYQGFNDDGSTNGLGGVVDISSLNGALWSDEDIHISGVLDGELTIGVDGTIHIRDDILYAGSTPGNGPDPDCDDILGLIAAGHPKGDIIIDYTTPNWNDCEVHGVMMALQKTIEAEDYQHHAVRGDFILYGGMLADYAIHLAQYSEGVVVSGYGRDYHFDPRVAALPPPFFPFAGSFSIVTWEEVVPPVPPEV
jgi:hypothetical protein